MNPSLSVVMPVHNESAHLSETVEALADAVSRSGLSAELIVVDDGSTDGSAETVRAAVAGRLQLEVLTQEREGRFKARRAGVAAAPSDAVLLLDARVRLHPDSLRFLASALSPELPVWNGHVVPQTRGNPFGAFGNVLVHIAWSAVLRRSAVARASVSRTSITSRRARAASSHLGPCCSRRWTSSPHGSPTGDSSATTHN